MLVVGKKEAAEKLVSIRRLGSQQQTSMTFQEALDMLAAEATGQSAATPPVARQLQTDTPAAVPLPSAAAPAGYGSAMAASFGAFRPRVRSYWDATTFYVESDNVPDNTRMPNLMVGITSWQQQIPLPASYFASTTNPENPSLSA